METVGGRYDRTMKGHVKREAERFLDMTEIL